MTRVTEPRKTETAPAIHDVKRGETLSGIAKRHGTTVAELVKLNGLRNPNQLSIGQDIKLPGKVREEIRKLATPPPKTDPDNGGGTKPGNKPHTTLAEFEKDVLGTPYKTPAPFCRTSPGADHSRYDCLTLVLKYLGEKGAHFASGRTDRGDKVLSDHLQPYAHVTLGENGSDLVCTNKKTGQKISRTELKEGDVLLVGHKYSKAEGNFSVYHLGIVKYERDDKGAVKCGKDGQPLIYMIHANSTGRYGQEREVVVTGLRTYLAQRAGDPKRSDENKSHYSEVLVCRVKPESASRQRQQTPTIAGN